MQKNLVHWLINTLNTQLQVIINTVIDMNRVLLVEDDAGIRDMICRFFNLKKENIIVDTAPNGEIGLELTYSHTYDLLLLDVMMPELDGFEMCREIRRYSDIPIMFITARTTQEDMLTGYALGCDDYIIKPFPLPVLYEKVKALIKRSKGLVRSDVLSTGLLVLNPNNGIVTYDGKEVDLKSKQYGILRVMLENKGSIVTREMLLNKVWGYDAMVDDRVIDTHIKNLRKALGGGAKLIKTVRRRGYRIEVQ